MNIVHANRFHHSIFGEGDIVNMTSLGSEDYQFTVHFDEIVEPKTFTLSALKQAKTVFEFINE